MSEGKFTERWAMLFSGWPMVALCVLGGSRWLLEGVRPQAQSTYATQAAGCLAAAGSFALADLWLRQRTQDKVPGIFPREPAQEIRRVVGGVFALAGPGLASKFAAGTIHTDDATLALAITPCVVAVGTAALGGMAGQDMTSRLWPGLAAIAGLLLLLPQPKIQDWRLGLALLAMPLLTGLGATVFSVAKVSSTSAGKPRPQRLEAWAALLGAAAVYGVLAWVSGRGEGAFSSTFTLTKEAVSLDGTTALLTTLALLRLGAMRWSAQFILLPLVALLEGVAFLRPELDSRSWLALGLLLISGLYLFFPGSEPPLVSIR